MPTDNVVEAILGRKAVKWDAFWHLFEWLLDSNQAHGLAESIRCQLLTFAFGESYANCVAKREYEVSGQKNGKGKFADFALAIPSLNKPDHLALMDDIGAAASGNKRKLNNLLEYAARSRTSHPNARIRVIVVTDAKDGKELAAAVYTLLKDEAVDFVATDGWKLLPLQTIGAWIRDAMMQRQEHLSEKAKFGLQEIAEWCEQQ
jgi:hypothetical protein